MEFSNKLTYVPGMARRRANQAKFENGGMQVRLNFYWIDFIFYFALK